MNAELELLFPYFQQQQQSFLPSEQVLSSLVQTTISAYNLGGEEDIFKAPEPIIEDPVLGHDPMTMVSFASDDKDINTQSINVSNLSSIHTHLFSETSTLSEHSRGGNDLFKTAAPLMEEPILDYDPIAVALSKITCGEDVISSQMIEAADIKSFQNECLLSELSYEWKDLMKKLTIDESFSKALDFKMKGEDSTIERDGSIANSPTQKSVSSKSLISMDWIDGGAMRSKFVDFQTMGFGAAYGMRRAFSEGDIQALGAGNTLGHYPLEQMPTAGNYTSEERKLRLSRYRIKKAKRNFGRKVKYACRKALADSQLRVRGRFAKVEEACAQNTSEWRN